MAEIRSITDVSEWQLCTGCGVCAYLEPERFRIGDAVEYGRRPFIRDKAPAETGEALQACPGLSLRKHDLTGLTGVNQELLRDWGPVLEGWEGFAADPETRWKGSSGGAATALARFCLERMGMHGVLHTGAREDAPYLNETVLSSAADELLLRTGSRYSPASPCEGLGRIESAPGKCVFIGKPCDAAAVAEARRLRPVLDEKLGLVIAFFCAGTPSTRGTLKLLHKAGIDNQEQLTSLRYRGNGWPGEWRAVTRGSAPVERTLSYEESWGYLQRFRPWRCYICPDHTGEYADIAVGDPWYRAVEENEAGKSLIVARTARGLEVIKSAASAGYLKLEARNAKLLPQSQPNLLTARGRLWGQLLALRMTGTPRPTYSGVRMFTPWLRLLNSRAKVSSLFGTARRVFSRNLKRRVSVIESAVTEERIV